MKPATYHLLFGRGRGGGGEDDGEIVICTFWERKMSTTTISSKNPWYQPGENEHELIDLCLP